MTGVAQAMRTRKGRALTLVNRCKVTLETGRGICFRRRYWYDPDVAYERAGAGTDWLTTGKYTV